MLFRDMRYKSICSFYATSRVVAGEGEMAEWSRRLNEYGESGWRVRGSGAIPDGPRIIFWALLAKPGKNERVDD